MYLVNQRLAEASPSPGTHSFPALCPSRRSAPVSLCEHPWPSSFASIQGHMRKAPTQSCFSWRTSCRKNQATRQCGDGGEGAQVADVAAKSSGRRPKGCSRAYKRNRPIPSFSGPTGGDFTCRPSLVRASFLAVQLSRRGNRSKSMIADFRDSHCECNPRAFDRTTPGSDVIAE